jgi:hypothetical protein
LTNEDDKEMNAMIKQIFAGGRIHQIKWDWKDPDKEAYSWDIERKFNIACDLASSMNQAADLLQQERAELFEKLDMAQLKLEAAENLSAIDKATLVDCITKNNTESQEAGITIQKLQARVKQQDALLEAFNGSDGA